MRAVVAFALALAACTPLRASTDAGEPNEGPPAPAADDRGPAAPPVRSLPSVDAGVGDAASTDASPDVDAGHVADAAPAASPIDAGAPDAEAGPIDDGGQSARCAEVCRRNDQATNNGPYASCGVVSGCDCGHTCAADERCTPDGYCTTECFSAGPTVAWCADHGQPSAWGVETTCRGRPWAYVYSADGGVSAVVRETAPIGNGCYGYSTPSQAYLCCTPERAP